ncbi:MAG: ABC transporter substrate-binding protein [Chromatiales bacterium]|jgi:phospholipid transport system substrate-binding protein
MNKKNVTRFLASLLAFVMITVNAAELTPAQKVIEGTSNEIKLVLNRDRDLLKSDPAYVYQMVDEILVPRFDLDRISGLVLGRYWKRANDDQKTRFQHEFKRMLIRTYATAFNELDNWEMKFLASRVNEAGTSAVVRTQITRNGAPPIDVDYSMRQRDGDWKVFDVRIEGMSLVTNYRSSFKRLMRTEGMDGLITHLQQTNNERVVAQTSNPDMQKVAHK